MAIETSIIVPTYKEAGNIRELICQVFDALQERRMSSCEMIVVDDNSQDGTEDLVNELSEKYNVRIIVRTKDRGLSSAVLRGFSEANGSFLLCMDADLQHPPRKVPDLVEALASGDTEFVIGTRSGAGEIDEGWPLHRRIISAGAKMLAQPLTPLSDPMTGFFGIRKDVFLRAKDVNSIGFKIAMELYVKSGVKKHKEVPFSFGVRVAGESKLSGAVIIQYLMHLKELYSYKLGILFPMLIVMFVLIGLFIAWFVAGLLL